MVYLRTLPPPEAVSILRAIERQCFNRVHKGNPKGESGGFPMMAS